MGGVSGVCSGWVNACDHVVCEWGAVSLPFPSGPLPQPQLHLRTDPAQTGLCEEEALE